MNAYIRHAIRLVARNRGLALDILTPTYCHVLMPWGPWARRPFSRRGVGMESRKKTPTQERTLQIRIPRVRDTRE